MDLASASERRPTVLRLKPGRASNRHVGPLQDLAAKVEAARPRLVDGWEATALIESLGYTDTRVQREFGCADTRAAGDYVYRLLRNGNAVDQPWTPPAAKSVAAIVVRSAASTLIYAVPWLALFFAQALRPDAMRLPAHVASALALALMFSLVASGGFVQAIVRRGEFYVGLRQPGLAWQVVGALLRIGMTLIAAAALAGVFAGWYFSLFEWPSLILAADSFVIMAALWMVCSLFSIKQQQWRVALAFLAGFGTFAAMRQANASVVTAQLTAAATVLVVTGLQARGLFIDRHTPIGIPKGVPLPKLAVVAYWTVPYFWYGVVYFGFLFADRLTAGTALVALGGPTFGVPAQYNLGMELALLTLLLAASGVEVAGALFARAFTHEAVRPIAGDRAPLISVLRRHHTRALSVSLITFVTTALGVSAIAGLLMPGALSGRAWSTLLAGDVGYACLAVGLLNALVLFETRRPWVVVRQFTAALAINLAIGYLSGHLFGTLHAVDGLLAGAAYLAASSTVAVRATLRRADYAYAIG